MSLIIAIEPDRDQAAHLKDLVRRHTGAELILADTTAHAINAIGQRVPDLVLIPAFLSPEDDEALTSALRVTEAAAHVQTLTIPLLGEPRQKSAAQGVLAKLRWDHPRPSSPDSCDPRVFAEQITEYLERVGRERGPVAGTNGKGSHGSNRRPDSVVAAAPASPERVQLPPAPPPASVPVQTAATAETSKPPAAVKPVAVSKTPAAPVRKAIELNVSALEAALAHVIIDAAPAAEPAAAPRGVEMASDAGGSLPPEEQDGLEEGLSSLFDRLSAEEPTPEAASAAVTTVEETDWAELKELESVDYKIPKIVPTDEVAPASKPAPPEPEPPAQTAVPQQAEPAKVPQQPTPPATKADSGWGDLMESLKKDLGR